MHITIRKYAGCGDMKEVNRIAMAELAPVLRKVAGFHSYVVVDMGNGVGASIGIFANKAAAEAGNQRAREVVGKTKLHELLPNPPEIIMGEVLSETR